MRTITAFLFMGILILIGIAVFWQVRGEEKNLGESCLSLYKNIAESPSDDPGVADYGTYSDLRIPPLHPDTALEKFTMEEGFRIEVVAHEPMVIDPVAMDIDADGRLWVINMPSYNMMPVRQILENTGERTEEREQALREQMPEAPAANVVVLEDTTGDGKMDTYRVFYEGLLLPRAIKVLNDGILLGEPPNLWFIRDTNGDGRGDTREIISDQYTTPRSPQSGPSALFWAMDNWMHNSHFPSIRRENGQWRTRSFQPLGQWGMTQDDWGRLYSSSNSWPLQAHLVPYGYNERHPIFGISSGQNTRIAPNEPVWPAHAPATNRSYRIGIVAREDGTLKIAAGTSSTVIYRGDQFGNEFQGNAFTPIGSGNLIKRIILEDDPAEIEAEGRFIYEGREFLTSTDERFRPVNIYNAPDGSIYVVDMYRGLYDYVLWVTDHLGEYTLENELDIPTGMFGRIYRIVRDDREIGYKIPKFSRLTPSDVVNYLRNSNGLLRDKAQQVLVQCSPSGVVSTLEGIAHDNSEEALTRLHALWTLEGFDHSVYRQQRLTRTALQALEDTHPRIRAAAVRILEPELAANSTEVLTRFEELTGSEPSPFVRLQMLASLGESSSETALRLIAVILNDHAESPYFREMALTGVYQREEQLAGILRSVYGWNDDRGEPYAELLANLTEVVEERTELDFGHLTEKQQELYEHGQMQYAICSACHGAEGEGMSGMGSVLAGSEWVNSDPDVLVRIILQGFEGGAAERGENIPNDMPGHAFLSDEDLAGIMTYLRLSWGNDSSPIDPDEVARIREATNDRSELWSPDELRELFD